MKKVILTLVLGLFFVAFSNAQSNNSPAGSKKVVSEKVQEVKTVVSDKAQEVKTDVVETVQEVKTDAKTYTVSETLSPGAGAPKSSCAGKAKKSCAGKSKKECATKKAACDAKKAKTEMKKTI